jgi:hypothetical protein
MLCYVMLCYVTVWYGMVWYGTVCYVMSCHVTPCILLYLLHEPTNSLNTIQQNTNHKTQFVISTNS